MAVYQYLARGIGKISLTLSLPILLAACADVGPYRPDPTSATVAIEKKFAAKGELRIINAQPSEVTHELTIRGIVVNYKDFTQALVEALKIEFQKQGVTLADNAGKKLLVKVNRVYMEPRGVNFRGHIFSDITMGDGTTESFHTTRASFASAFMLQNFPTKPLNEAFKDMVGIILNSSKIRAYLEE